MDINSEETARLECFRWMTMAADKMISTGFRDEGLSIRKERDKMVPRLNELKSNRGTEKRKRTNA
jgi:hypothetical protein